MQSHTIDHIQRYVAEGRGWQCLHLWLFTKYSGPNGLENLVDKMDLINFNDLNDITREQNLHRSLQMRATEFHTIREELIRTARLVCANHAWTRWTSFCSARVEIMYTSPGSGIISKHRSVAFICLKSRIMAEWFNGNLHFSPDAHEFARSFAAPKNSKMSLGTRSR